MAANVLGISSIKETIELVTGIVSNIFTDVASDSLYKISISVTL